MSLKTLVRLVPTVLILSGLSAMRPAAAQFVTFGTAQTISGVSDVSTSGTLADAYNFGGTSATVNTVLFSSMNSTTGAGHLSISGADGGFFNGYGNNGTGTTAYSSLDSTYQSLITNGLYRGSGTGSMAFTQSNLIAGHRYQVQYFVNDSRSLAATRTESVTSSGGNSQTLSYNTTASTTNADGGVGQYVNGTFTAAASAVTMTATGNASTQINGLQYRDLGNAGAAITFGTVTAIGTADATLGGQSGTIISAADFGAGTQIVTLTGGQTISFDGTSSANATVVGGNGTTTGAFTGTTGNTNFNSVLNGFNYDSAAGTKQITLSGLTAGKQYSVQLFGLDDRGGNESSRTLSFSDFSNNSSGAITSGANDYVIGTFTAASSFQTITESVPSGGNINAVVVRDLSAAPEPSQFACLAFTALGMAGLLLKARKRTASVKLS